MRAAAPGQSDELTESPARIILALNIGSAQLQAKSIKQIPVIKKHKVKRIVLGIGGYVTLPVLSAAHSLKIKTFIHEQNSIPGLSNKLLTRKVDAIGVSLPSSLNHFDKKKTTYTGNPRSEEVINVEKVDKKKYGLTKNKKRTT